jgi:protein gp37
MGDIEWTDETWNPTDGCKVCSPGCANCYAMRFAGRFAKPGERYHGLVTIGKNRRAIWSGRGRLDAGKLAKPLHWKRPRRIFVNSMSDLFYEEFTNEEIAAVFGVMAACPQHTFQFLTKREMRMREWFKWLEDSIEAEAIEWSGRDCAISIDEARRDCLLEYLDETACAALAGHFDCCHLGLTTNTNRAWPLVNVWPGVSVEDRKHGVPRIDELRQVPAVVRMLSCEPLLEDLGALDLTGIGWLIAGCESGPKARPVDPDAYRSLREQCAAARVPFFLKQAREDVERCTEGCGEIVRYTATGPGDALAACGCTVEGPESCNPTGIMFGEDSKRKAGGIIGLPYLDGVQHRAFPDTKEMRP